MLLVVIKMSHIIAIFKIKNIVYTTVCMIKRETKIHYLLSDRYLLTWYDEIVVMELNK